MFKGDIMDNLITIYHGSEKIIRKPVFGEGNPKNDYGLGFYCTENVEIAKEWACTEENSGYANEYNLSIGGLSVLNLSNSNYNILNWLAILLENRTFKISGDIAVEGKEYLMDKFMPDYKSFDIIIGYRADDSYFSFANAFLNNTLSLQQLARAMYLGKLGEQIVLKSMRAFEHITFVNAIPAEKDIYYPVKKERDKKARSAYCDKIRKSRAASETYLVDILRKEWDSDYAGL